MINLLPPIYKNLLSQEKTAKIILTLGLDLLLVLVCFSLILSSLNIFLLGEIRSQKILYEQKKKEMERSEIEELEKNLTILNKTFSDLDYFYQHRFQAIETIIKISKVVPLEIRLTNLALTPKPKEKIIECTLSGFSPNREALLQFKENLETKDYFKEVYFPPANWVKPTDINFTVNFQIIWP